MDFETSFNRCVEYFEEREEHAFLLKAGLLIAAVFIARSIFISFMPYFILLFIFSPVIYWMLLRVWTLGTERSASTEFLRNITFLPVPITEKEWKTEGTAWVTYALIFTNLFVFYLVQPGNRGVIRSNFVALPFSPEFWNVPLSFVTSMFLHSGNGHLWGNMLFLWAFGTVLEKRVGSGRFLKLYLLTGILSVLFGIVIHWIFVGGAYHCWGASGAISGIMGIYAVRCYFKTLLMPLPLLGIFSLLFSVYLKVRVNALVLIGLFFLPPPQNLWVGDSKN
jgi:membrane associated rhomboid family serine protease